MPLPTELPLRATTFVMVDNPCLVSRSRILAFSSQSDLSEVFMNSVFKFTKSLFRRPPWPQLRFPTAGFDIISDKVLHEEEQLDGFRKGVYYPVNIGDVFASQYQVVGKLGFGVTSTVWLARDLQCVKATRLFYGY